MNINLKFCERCGRGFDIGTNFNICPSCRLEEVRNRIKREEELNKTKRRNENGREKNSF